MGVAEDYQLLLVIFRASDMITNMQLLEMIDNLH